MNYKNKNEIKFDEIRVESGRIWGYLEDAISCLENKYYLLDCYDINELLAYCKSCLESYETIKILTYELENEIARLENEQL